MKTFKLKLRLGSAEFEAEGDQRFVEKHLQAFKPLLNLPGIKEAKPGRNPGLKPRRKARKTKPTAKAYPVDAVESLQVFLAKAKPKGQPATAVALGAHHLKHFKTPSFKNQDVLAAAKTIGFKFTNLALSLRAAAKQGKIRKVKKGTWRLASPEAKPSQNTLPKKRATKPKLPKNASPVKRSVKPAARVKQQKPSVSSKPSKTAQAASQKSSSTPF